MEKKIKIIIRTKSAERGSRRLVEPVGTSCVGHFLVNLAICHRPVHGRIFKLDNGTTDETCRDMEIPSLKFLDFS